MRRLDVVLTFNGFLEWHKYEGTIICCCFLCETRHVILSNAENQPTKALLYCLFLRHFCEVRWSLTAAWSPVMRLLSYSSVWTYLCRLLKSASFWMSLECSAYREFVKCKLLVNYFLLVICFIKILICWFFKISNPTWCN